MNPHRFLTDIGILLAQGLKDCPMFRKDLGQRYNSLL